MEKIDRTRQRNVGFTHNESFDICLTGTGRSSREKISRTIGSLE